MKKLIALLTIAGFITFGISNSVLAQQEENTPQTEQVAAEATEQVAEDTFFTVNVTDNEAIANIYNNIVSCIDDNRIFLLLLQPLKGV